jgi:hypothetical protein
MRPLMSTCAVALLTLAMGTAPGARAETALAQGPCLLSASQPGAYALRYWPDCVVLSYSAQDPVTVRVGLPQPGKWVMVDDKAPLAAKSWNWVAGEKCLSVELPAGEHRARIGWGAAYRPPPTGLRLPVTMGERVVGTLQCTFDLEKMTATGTVSCPTAMARPFLQPSGALTAEQVTLGVGALSVTRWRSRNGGLLAAAPVAVRPDTPVSLTVRAYGLTASPLRSVQLQSVELAVDPLRVAEMPTGGLVVEAEAFTAEGNGKADISEKHFGTHGGKCIYGNAGDGHWLEWRFEVAEAGQYDLYCRAACQEAESLRAMALDGKPLPGGGLVRFPGTGGWGYSAAEWWALQLAGGKLPAPPLQLTAGPHALRITGVSSDHLNLDYFVLVRR